MGLLAGPLLALALAPGTTNSRAPAPVETRTYQFQAKIKDNGGVTPFEVGESITGTFTYDRRSNPIRSVPNCAHRVSDRNAIVFELGDLKFVGTDEVVVAVSSFEGSEHFGMTASDLTLPKGWDMLHKKGSQSYGFALQNVPPKKKIDGTSIPTELVLSDFTSSAEVWLDFYNGVSFPGGAVKGRATVMAHIESLKEVKR
jgi:hypothetical protein